MLAVYFQGLPHHVVAPKELPGRSVCEHHVVWATQCVRQIPGDDLHGKHLEKSWVGPIRRWRRALSILAAYAHRVRYYSGYKVNLSKVQLQRRCDKRGGYARPDRRASRRFNQFTDLVYTVCLREELIEGEFIANVQGDQNRRGISERKTQKIDGRICAIPHEVSQCSDDSSCLAFGLTEKRCHYCRGTLTHTGALRPVSRARRAAHAQSQWPSQSSMQWQWPSGTPRAACRRGARSPPASAS